MDWDDAITKIDGLNLLGLYDVMMDIQEEINLETDLIVIPLFPNVIKFQQLLPVDAIGTRDAYCERRWKMLEFLEKKEILKKVIHGHASHRWESRIQVTLKKDVFSKAYKVVQNEYKRRHDGRKHEGGMEEFPWQMLHPKVIEIGRSRVESGHFTDAVEAVLKEVNDIVKIMVKQKTGKEFDGADLMNQAFSLSSPTIVLDDLSTENGKNIQKGYMQIFAGSMTGIRNPKAHKNLSISRERAIHLLFLASLLMFKIDEKM